MTLRKIVFEILRKLQRSSHMALRLHVTVCFMLWSHKWVN